MKKFVSLALSLAIVFTSLLSAVQISAETNFSVNQIGNEGKKVINIVYDDSGSMVNGSETDVSVASAYVATWAQAKYSLEMFTAMLNNDDVLNIFCMSDSGELTKSIKGAEKNKGVSDLHDNFKTGDYSVLTPIQTLNNAYKALSDKKYDGYEKWLVVLTDGAFTVSNKSGDLVKDSNVSSTLSSYGKSLNGNLIYIPIGGSAREYNADTYTQLKASSGEEILNQLKSATELIYYQRDKKEVSETSLNLGVSMKKIIVFAQGAGVEIQSVSKGKISNNISVMYTQADKAVNYSSSGKTFSGNESKIKTDTSLQGVVATIEPNGEYIEPGQLNIVFGDAKPKSFTIYYEPAVKTYFSLTKDGVEYLSSENETTGGSLNPGTYRLEAYIADAYLTDENGKPADVSLASEIQDIAFDVEFSGSGIENSSQKYTAEQLKNGVDIKLNRGEIDCKSAASILNGKYDIDTSSMVNAFSSVKVKDTYRLEIEYQKPNAQFLSYKFKKTNFNLHSLNKINDEKQMIKAVVTCYDENNKEVPITDELWSQVTIQTLQRYDDETKVIYDDGAYNFHTENGKGVFYLCPRYWEENDKPDKGKTTHTKYFSGDKLCTVRCEIYIDVSDSLAYSTLGTAKENKSTTYEISLCMWHTIIFLFVFFWIFFCIVKKRLPKNRKGTLANKEAYTEEMIRGKTDWVGADEYNYKRDSTVMMKRKFSTVVIPFIPQQGEIRLGAGVPSLKIKATEVFGKRTHVQLMNKPSDFAGINGNNSPGLDNRFLSLKGKSITEETLKSNKKKKFIFSVTQSSIVYCGCEGSVFRKYSLSFNKRKKNKKKGKKK